MASFASVVSGIVSAVSVAVSVCSAVSYTGNTNHHSQPQVRRIDPNDIAHRGPYLGSRHTASLEKARTTIFLKPGAGSVPGVMALHVEESQMVLTQRIMSANGVAVAKEAQNLVAPAPKASAAIRPKFETSGA